jgi:MOSC domain-containing protein YiiM
MSGRVTAVCVAPIAEQLHDGRTVRTAIDKRPVDGRVAAGHEGLTGDAQADRRHHGGPDAALYVYADEDADHWTGALERELRPGSFGENLRTRGLDVSAALVGERWRTSAGVVLEVSGPRTPCRTLAGALDVADMVARSRSAGRPGAYLRVIETGDVGAGDGVQVIHRPSHGITVAQVLRLRTGPITAEQASSLADLDGLEGRLRAWARGVLERRGD